MKSENKSQKSEKPFKKSRLSKPLALLNTFSQEELNNFQELIKCDYLTNKNISYLLLNSLQKFALTNCEKFKPRLLLNRLKDSTSKKKEKEKMELQFEKLIEELKQSKFPEEIQNVVCIDVFKKDKTTGDTQSKEFNKELNKLKVFAETFLKFETIRTTDEYDVELLLPELRKRNQVLLYDKHIKATEEKLEDEEEHGIGYHSLRCKIEEEKASEMFENNKLSTKVNYNTLQQHLDTQYLLKTLHYHLAKVTLQSIYEDKTFDFKPFNAIKKLIDLPIYKNNLLIKLYLLNIELIQKDNDKTFFKLSAHLKKHLNTSTSSILKPFFTNLTNYCSVQIMKGRLDFNAHQFKIYKHMHFGKLLNLDGSIYPRLLKNIITTSCSVKKFSWALDILEYYKKFIKIDIRESVYNYNLGIIYFNQKKYEEALNCLGPLNKIDDIHEIGARVTILKCFYERDTYYEIETVQTIKSFKQYFYQNTKIKKNMKIAYKNFIDIFNKLYKYKFSKNKQATSEIESTILKTEFIREKIWLLNKIKELTK